MRDNEYMTRREVAEMLGVSMRTVDRYAAQGILQRYGILKLVLFARAQVEGLLIPRAL